MQIRIILVAYELNGYDFSSWELTQTHLSLHQHCWIKIKNHPPQQVWLVPTGIGTNNAAATISSLLTYCAWHQFASPIEQIEIINLGYACGLNDHWTVGEWTRIHTTSFNDFDLTAFHYQYGQVPNFPAQFHLTDSNPLNITKSAHCLSANQFCDANTPIHPPTNNEWPLVYDMELAAISQVVHSWKRQTKMSISLVAYKLISDCVSAHAPNVQQLQKSETEYLTALVNMLKILMK